MAFHHPSNCEKNRDLVLKMVEDGASLTKIAKAVGTSGRHVRKFLKDNGIVASFSYGSPGQKHPNWKGGRTISKGYVDVYAPFHPNAKKSKRVAEHRIVMEQHLGRLLEDHEVVHHKNGNPTDNRIENLDVFSTNGEHLKKTIVRKPNWSKDGIRRMKEGIARSAKLRRPETRIQSGSDVREWQ